MLSNVKLSQLYLNVDEFIDDFSNHQLKDNFILDEDTFQQLISKMQTDRNFANQINDQSVVLLMAARDKKEIEDLLVMAETFLDGR
jgi:hypothetical protein